MVVFVSYIMSPLFKGFFFFFRESIFQVKFQNVHQLAHYYEILIIKKPSK